MDEMEKVSRDVFFAFIHDDKSDIMPRVEREASYWEQAHTRTPIGRTTPGYMCVGPKEYFLIPQAAAAGRAALTRKDSR